MKKEDLIDLFHTHLAQIDKECNGRTRGFFIKDIVEGRTDSSSPDSKIAPMVHVRTTIKGNVNTSVYCSNFLRAIIAFSVNFKGDSSVTVVPISEFSATALNQLFNNT